MKLSQLIPLNELEFTNQDSFDAYRKNHKIKPDTKIKIAGKETTAGAASKKENPGLLKKLGAKLFGKPEEKPAVPVPKVDPKNPINKKTIFDPKRGNSVTVGKILSDPEKYNHLVSHAQAAIDVDPTGEKAAKQQAKKKADSKRMVQKTKEYRKWREDNPELAAKQDAAAMEKIKKMDASDEMIRAIGQVADLKRNDKKFRESGIGDALITGLVTGILSNTFGDSDDDDKKYGGGSFGGGGAGSKW